jgi:hypothetical protein
MTVTLSLIVFGASSDTFQTKNTKLQLDMDRMSSQGYFEFPQQLSNTNKHAFWPSIAINSSDVIMVCYAEDVGAGFQGIFYTMSSDGGETWTTPTRTYSIDEEPKSLDLDADSNGNFHLVYSDGASSATRQIYHREYKNGQWQPKTQLSQINDNSNWCRIACDGKKVHIVWYQELGWPIKPTIYLMTRDENGVWPEQPENAAQDSTNGHISPCVSAYNGNVYAAWQIQYYSGTTLTGKEVVFKEKRNGVWQPTFPIGERTWPGIQADTLGNVHVIYSDGPRANYRMREGQNTWHEPEKLDTTAAVGGFFDLAYKNNTVIAVFMQNASRNPDHYSIWFRTKKFVQGWESWGTAVEVDPGGYGDLPKVVIDNEGYAHILWADWHTQAIREADTIWYNKFLVAGPSGPFLLLDQYSLSFEQTQYEAATPQIVKVRNSGPGTLNFQAAPDSDWLSVSPTGGTSEGDWVEITVSVDTEIAVGTHTGAIQFTSDEAENSPVDLAVTLTILAPPIFAPLNFAGVKVQNNSLLFRETVHQLTWEVNPLNTNIASYRITLDYETNGVQTQQIFTIPSYNLSFTNRNIDPNTAYTYTLQAINDKGAAGQATTVTIE